MYFWKVTLLKQHLIKNRLTETQLFCYILTYIAMSAISSMDIFGDFPATEPDLWIYADSALNILIPIIGTFAAFHANGGGTGVNFAERYFSLGLVVTIRFVVLLIPVIALITVYWAYTYGLESDSPDPSSSIVFPVIWIWYIAMYANIAKHIGNVAKA